MSACPACEKEIPPRDPVVFREGKMYHLRCAAKEDARARKRDDEGQRRTNDKGRRT